MRVALTLFALGAAAAAGYLVGDRGGAGVAAFVVAGVGALALVLALKTPATVRPGSLSTRVEATAPRSEAARQVTASIEAALRQREQEQLLTSPAVGVRLIDCGRNQIAVIKALRTYLDLGLKEAKDLSDGARRGANPLLAAAMESTRAREFVREIERAGGRAEFEEAAIR